MAREAAGAVEPAAASGGCDEKPSADCSVAVSGRGEAARACPPPVPVVWFHAPDGCGTRCCSRARRASPVPRPLSTASRAPCFSSAVGLACCSLVALVCVGRWLLCCWFLCTGCRPPSGHGSTLGRMASGSLAAVRWAVPSWLPHASSSHCTRWSQASLDSSSSQGGIASTY